MQNNYIFKRRDADGCFYPRDYFCGRDVGRRNGEVQSFIEQGGLCIAECSGRQVNEPVFFVNVWCRGWLAGGFLFEEKLLEFLFLSLFGFVKDALGVGTDLFL